MQLVGQRVEGWGRGDPPHFSLSPSCGQGSSLATAPRCGSALTTWTPVEAGSGQTTRLSSTSTGRVVRRRVWGAGWPGDPTSTWSPRDSFPDTLLQTSRVAPTSDWVPMVRAARCLNYK